MAVTLTPITLAGAELGQRHRHFNALVAAVHASGTIWRDVEHSPEYSPIDRLFKIDLASKLKNVDYVIRNLQDDDMLYVSKSLKAKWLLDPQHRSIINPKHVEEVLFPQMITPAISKMKCWLYINLRDPGRCAEFYEYYKEKSYGFAIKFLCNCSTEYILKEFPKILPKITPHYLKIFCEKSPKFAIIYFDAVYTGTEITAQYLKNARNYYNSIKCVLKSEPDVFLDITEKTHVHKDLSPGATEFIVTQCKTRFMEKAELYTANLLHMPTIAKNLSVSECELLVLRLARARYLGRWFSYQNVEPLVKRLSPDSRAAFKKRVFVDHDVGEIIDKWPYPMPQVPEVKTTDKHVFKDEVIKSHASPKMLHCSAQIPRCAMSRRVFRNECVLKRRETELDRLFNEYRFIGFDRSFRELSRRIGAASSIESRRDLFLVLVSKTGGREECVTALLGLMSRHENEPANLRAAIVRSLVKRARVWRLAGGAWDSLLAFGRGLGLDGGPAEAECQEGLHAVVLRHLLFGIECDLAVHDAFLKQFSTLSDYPLAANERPRVVAGLTQLLTTAAAKCEPKISARYLQNLLDVYSKHKIRIDPGSGIVPAARELASRDLNAARDILSRLYKTRVARKELFLVNLDFRRDAASYLNVLRHDPSAFSPQRLIEQLVNTNDKVVKSRGSRHFDRFTQKLSLYFSEGLAVQFLYAIKAKIAEKPDERLARPLAAVIGQDMKSYLETFDTRKEDVGVRRMAAALSACGHRCRPQLDIDAYELKDLGAQAVAACVLVCRDVDVDKYVKKLLSWRGTVRVAVVLAQRSGHEADAFATAAKLRPVVVIKTALTYFHRRGDNADFKVWETVKPLIVALNVSSKHRIFKKLTCVNSISSIIRCDYIVTLFFTLIKNPYNITMYTLHRDLQILLPDINRESVEKILLFLLEKKNCKRPYNACGSVCVCNLYPSIFIRYLLLCESEEEQIIHFEKIGRPFLELVDTLPSTTHENFLYRIYLRQILLSLKYNKACFDTKYVSCLPVFEKIVAWMKKKLSIETYFDEYSQIDLNILYFKAVRQSIQEMPEVFQNSKRKMDEGVEIVGFAFGKNIAKHLRDMTSTYFDSIVELYKEPFVRYMTTYFPVYTDSTYALYGSMVKGIIEGSVGSELRFGVHIIENDGPHVNRATIAEIKKILRRKGDVAQFFLYNQNFNFSEECE